MSRLPGQIFRRGDTPRFALPLLFLFHFFVLTIMVVLYIFSIQLQLISEANAWIMYRSNKGILTEDEI